MIKILLDPGHSRGVNAGYVKSYYEGDTMQRLADYLKAALEQYAGVSVSLTKTSVGANPSVDARGKMAATGGYDMFLSLHSDAFTMGGTACGVTVYRSAKRPESAAFLKELGNAIVGAMKPASGNTYMRGVKTNVLANGNDYYGVIRGSVGYAGTKVKVAALVEHGFHTNPAECKALADDKVLRRIAEAEAGAIARYYGLKAVGNPQSAATPEAAAKGYKLRVYEPYHASTSFAATEGQYKKDVAGEPKIKMRACTDGKWRLYKPVAAFESAEEAKRRVSSDNLVLLEVA